MIKYQDRIMFGTDVTIRREDTDYETVSKNLRQRWLDQWLFLATGSVISVEDLGGKQVKGLQLPREVIDKIYSKNAIRFFNLSQQ
jgi:predicted TIM-barrel fold metal-dependent hydrolase